MKLNIRTKIAKGFSFNHLLSALILKQEIDYKKKILSHHEFITGEAVYNFNKQLNEFKQLNNFNSWLIKTALCEKFHNAEFFLVRIFPNSDCILRKSPYLVRIRKIQTRKSSVFRHFSRSVVLVQIKNKQNKTPPQKNNKKIK